MITAAAICPHPPLLFRELTGRRDIVGDLRAACVAVIGSVVACQVDTIVVVGGADATGPWDATLEPEIRRFGTVGPREPRGLPESLGVGKRLLREAGWAGAVDLIGIAWDAPLAEVEKVGADLASRPGRTGLLVMGDGSTRRGDKAPGYLDERAFPFDETTGRALAEGSPEGLLGMDPGLAEELMVRGRAAFQVLGAAVRRQGGEPRPTMAYQNDPYGVMYFVALWEL